MFFQKSESTDTNGQKIQSSIGCFVQMVFLSMMHVVIMIQVGNSNDIVVLHFLQCMPIRAANADQIGTNI
jgi:hypothetical protein